MQSKTKVRTGKIITFILSILPIGWVCFDFGFWKLFFIVIQSLSVIVLVGFWWADREEIYKSWMTSRPNPDAIRFYEDNAKLKNRLYAFIHTEIKNAENAIKEPHISCYKVGIHKGRLIAYKQIETRLYQIERQLQ